MRVQIASFIEIRASQIRVAYGLACILSPVLDAETGSVRTSETVSTGTPFAFTARKMVDAENDSHAGPYGDRRSRNAEERDQAMGGLSRAKEGAS